MKPLYNMENGLKMLCAIKYRNFWQKTDNYKKVSKTRLMIPYIMPEVQDANPSQKKRYKSSCNIWTNFLMMAKKKKKSVGLCKFPVPLITD